MVLAVSGSVSGLSDHEKEDRGIGSIYPGIGENRQGKKIAERRPIIPAASASH
jgi:hypothetical protein